MGEGNAEPSMEDILSSIKRIIAEDGENPPARQRRPVRTASTASFPRAVDPAEPPEVLELSNPAPAPDEEYDAVAEAEVDPTPAAPGEPVRESIVSHDVLASSRGSLDALTRMVGRPETGEAVGDLAAGKSVEAFVADLLRPLLREWLDANLPELVEQMVAKEIARITGNR